jgi:hypothetical protein
MKVAAHAHSPAPIARVPISRPVVSMNRTRWTAGQSNQMIQAKLRVGAVDDPLEHEAERVADAVVGGGSVASLAHAPGAVQRKCAACAANEETGVQRKCEDCEAQENETVRRRATDGITPRAPPGGAATAAAAVASGGAPLSPDVRSYFEPRFGRDLSDVRVHTHSRAHAAAQTITARAYTLGPNIAFAHGEFSPGTQEGRRLIAHELAHVAQQTAAAPSLSTAPPDTISRQLDPSLCASDCTTRDNDDNSGYPTGKYILKVHADKEGAFLLMPATKKVGHAWVEFIAPNGDYWTYGFWPQSGFDPSNPRADVDGCVHHPDTSHKPTATQEFELTETAFERAKDVAVRICEAQPKYNLFGMQCTEFAKLVLEAAGQVSSSGFGLIWESPNALSSWIKGNSFLLGIGVSATSTAPGRAGQGDAAAILQYRHQFYAALGGRLRLHWESRGELSKRVFDVSSGLSLEYAPRKVYLPAPYVFGGGTVGSLSPTRPAFGEGARAGAGFTGAVGARFNIDEIATIGVEYNLVKDLVNKDPALGRLMFVAGIRF